MEKSGGRPCIDMPGRNEVCARVPVELSQLGVVRCNKEADASSPYYETSLFGAEIAERYPYKMSRWHCSRPARTPTALSALNSWEIGSLTACSAALHWGLSGMECGPCRARRLRNVQNDHEQR